MSHGKLHYKAIGKETVMYYREDGAPIAKLGKLSDGSYRAIVANPKRRIFNMDNVVRKQRQSKESLERIFSKVQ